MITGWLVKLVLGIAVTGFVAIELGTPLVVRAQLDGSAHDAADEAGFVIRDGGSQEAAAQAAAEVAAKNDADVEAVGVDEQGKVSVTLRKQAKSYLLKKWDRLQSWYEVRVSATSEGRR